MLSATRPYALRYACPDGRKVKIPCQSARHALYSRPMTQPRSRHSHHLNWINNRSIKNTPKILLEQQTLVLMNACNDENQLPILAITEQAKLDAHFAEVGRVPADFSLAEWNLLIRCIDHQPAPDDLNERVGCLQANVSAVLREARVGSIAKPSICQEELQNSVVWCRAPFVPILHCSSDSNHHITISSPCQPRMAFCSLAKQESSYFKPLRKVLRLIW